MEKDPVDRYGSAQEVADDLRRFLEDRPIRARRPTLRDQVRKWARRHPGLVAAAVVMLLLLAAVSSVSALLIWQAQQRTAHALIQAEEQRRFSRRAVDEMYTQVAEQWLAD